MKKKIGRLKESRGHYQEPDLDLECPKERELTGSQRQTWGHSSGTNVRPKVPITVILVKTYDGTTWPRGRVRLTEKKMGWRGILWMEMIPNKKVYKLYYL